MTTLVFDFPIGVDLCGGNWGRNTWLGQVSSRHEVSEIPVSQVILCVWVCVCVCVCGNWGRNIGCGQVSF